MSSRKSAPRLPWDAVDPFPFYERRRSDGDIVWDDTAQAWLVLGYHAAQRVLGGSGWTVDPLASPSARAAKDSVGTEFFNQSMLNTDGAAHQRLRRAVRDVFAPSFVAGLAAGVDAIAEAVIDGRPSGEVFDFMIEVAQPIPLAVIGEWLGLDAASTKLLGEQTQEVIRMVRPLATTEDFTTGTAASATLVTHLLPLAAQRRSNPSDDLLSFLASDPDIGLDEAVVTAVNIAVGALENTADFLGAATARLLSPGADGTRLVDELDVSDPSLVHELLRLDSPQAIWRTATEVQQIAGTEIAPGEQVVIVLAAANRDPAAFDEPDHFQLGRRGPAPLMFGHGEHFCLGAALARLESDVVLSRILARDPVISGPVTWHDTPARRGPLELPIVFRAP